MLFLQVVYCYWVNGYHQSFVTLLPFLVISQNENTPKRLVFKIDEDGFFLYARGEDPTQVSNRIIIIRNGGQKSKRERG